MKSCRLLKSYLVTHPITCLYNIFDGTTSVNKFEELVNQFHNGWKDMLLVGCRSGHAYLLNLDVSDLHEPDTCVDNEWVNQNRNDYIADHNDSDNEEENKRKSKEIESTSLLAPVRAKRTVPLTSNLFFFVIELDMLFKPVYA